MKISTQSAASVRRTEMDVVRVRSLGLILRGIKPRKRVQHISLLFSHSNAANAIHSKNEYRKHLQRMFEALKITAPYAMQRVFWTAKLLQQKLSEFRLCSFTILF
jgi:hypothetical protein